MRSLRSHHLISRVSHALDVPSDIALNLPRTTLEGNRRLVLENHRGIVEYRGQNLRIRTTAGEIQVIGTGLIIRFIDGDEIVIDGRFRCVEFIPEEDT